MSKQPQQAKPLTLRSLLARNHAAAGNPPAVIVDGRGRVIQRLAPDEAVGGALAYLAGAAAALQAAHEAAVEKKKLQDRLDAVAAIAAPRAPENTGAGALDSCSLDVLEQLKKARPETVSLYALQTATNLSLRTLGPLVQKLVSRGLASRPLGRRRGAAITPRGLACLISAS
jgi:hypothetical protein